ncbi:uncharacterized protein DFL_008308 [Arthrobotrys flagrans]|uniref:Uncharacterized protein n=1 Tax=Arthrobotrys flagrans TaxID=97331 RepID=A0A436ZND4_ARTFL|nr:hypothetical protein DFL_008308 [Arthrobotrys flagrans]
MAHRLNDLTEEGQYILLSHLGKIDAIENFCDVYPQFRRTYYSRIESFKEISPNWLLQDSYTYLRESIWIANYRGVLNRWDTPTAEVKGAIDQYVAYELTGRRMPAGEWQKGDSCYDMPVDGIQDKLIANHRYILKLYRHLVGYELNRRDATENGGAVRRTLRTSASQQPSKANKVKVWPTVYEKQNFVRALYRLWVLVLMGCEHKRPLDRNLWLGCVMGIWNGDFWGSIHVMAVQKIIHEAIASAIDETIYKDKEKTIPRGDIDSAMFEPNFKIEIASASLLHDFPALVPNWFQAVGTPTNRQKREEHINDIREFLKRRVCVDRDVPSANLSIFDTHSEFYKSNLVEGRYINQSIGFQRVSKRGAGLEVMPYSGNLLWVQLDDIKNPAASSLDLSVVIWDNWRCKTWGFKNPSFNRTNVSLIPPGST